MGHVAMTDHETDASSGLPGTAGCPREAKEKR
jgi:hypothetical protein